MGRNQPGFAVDAELKEGMLDLSERAFLKHQAIERYQIRLEPRPSR